MAVALLQGDLDGLADLVGLGLPGAQANGGDLVARVEGEGFPIDLSEYSVWGLLLGGDRSYWVCWFDMVVVRRVK